MGPLQVDLALEAMSGPAPEPSLDFAWRVHAALDNWIGKVDAKASIVLALESAVFGFVVVLSQSDGQFASLSGAASNAQESAFACSTS